jgi:hypothetical protein
MQHLKFQSRQLARYHAPPGVIERAIFRGNAMWEKYFLISLKAHSTLTEGANLNANELLFNKRMSKARPPLTLTSKRKQRLL